MCTIPALEGSVSWLIAAVQQLDSGRLVVAQFQLMLAQELVVADVDAVVVLGVPAGCHVNASLVKKRHEQTMQSL